VTLWYFTSKQTIKTERGSVLRKAGSLAKNASVLVQHFFGLPYSADAFNTRDLAHKIFTARGRESKLRIVHHVDKLDAL